MKNPRLIVTVAGVTSFGVGLVVGYKVAEKRLGDRFEQRLEDETADMREFYTNVKQKYNSPEEAAKALIPKTEKEPEDPRVNPQKVNYNKIVKQEQYTSDGLDEFAEDNPEACEIDEKPVHRNVFEDNQPPGVPRIITQDDFMANETGYEQTTLTYYLKGNVLTDQHDEVIDNAEEVIGPLAAHNFGEGSSDPNTVHVRNDKIQMEFEVVKSERSYEEDVLGQDGSESPDRRIRRQG
jgi:hypothetical protein